MAHATDTTTHSGTPNRQKPERAWIPMSRRRRGAIVTLSWLTIALTTAGATQFLTAAGREWINSDAGTAVMFIPVITSGVAIWLAARSQPQAGRPGWTLIAAGTLAWVAGGIVAAIEYTPGAEMAGFQLSDIPYVLAYPLILVGLWKIPAAAGPEWTKRRVFVDGAAGALSLGVVIWYLVWRPYVQPAFSGDIVGASFNTFYLLGDAAILVVVAALLARRSRLAISPNLGRIAAAVAIAAVSDLGYLVKAAVGIYDKVSLISLGWLAVHTLVALAALSLLRKDEIADTSSPTFRWWQFTLPYVGLVVLMVMMFATEMHGWEEKVVIAAIWAVVGLIVLRQYFAIKETTEIVNKKRNHLIASISHELRTPLTVVAGYLGVLDEMRSHLEEDVAEMVGEAAEHSAYMGRIVTDLVEVTRGGRITVTPETIDLGEICRRAAGAAAGGGRLEMEIEDGIVTEADPVRITQVVTNLVTNAFRYGGGETLLRVYTGVRGPVIEVHDNGPGVPAEWRDAIWEEFERGAHHLDSTIPGTGLGLAIVRTIAHAHGGDVAYSTSERLGGACFAVRLGDSEAAAQIEPRRLSARAAMAWKAARQAIGRTASTETH